MEILLNADNAQDALWYWERHRNERGAEWIAQELAKIINADMPKNLKWGVVDHVA